MFRITYLSVVKHRATFSAEKIEIVGFPIKPFESLQNVGQVQELMPINFIPLVIALD